MKRINLIIIFTVLCTTIAIWIYAFRDQRPEELIIVKPKFGNISTGITAKGTIKQIDIVIPETASPRKITPVLFTIAKDPAKLQVRALADKDNIGSVKAGERVTFTIDAVDDYLFNGTVEKIHLEPAASSNIVTYTTIIDVANARLKLKPGMTADIAIYMKGEDSTMIIPAKALKFVPDPGMVKETIIKNPSSFINKNLNLDIPVHKGINYNTTSISTNVKTDSVFYKEQYVWVKSGDELFQRRIFVGLRDDINVQVVYGLTDNDEIVIGIF
ncbi:MAG: efflux RND transporter periplasmic adaptor subunit [Ginsengibacter sp.]